MAHGGFILPEYTSLSVNAMLRLFRAVEWANDGVGNACCCTPLASIQSLLKTMVDGGGEIKLVSFRREPLWIQNHRGRYKLSLSFLFLCAHNAASNEAVMRCFLR